MSEDYFGLRGGTGLKLGRVSEATSIHSRVYMHVPICLCVRFE